MVNQKDETPFAVKKAFFEFLGPYLLSPEDMERFRPFASLGLIDIPSLFEEVLAHLSNGAFTRTPETGYDFSDFSEAKTASSRFRKNNISKGNWLHSATINNITVKKGLIRAMVYDTYNCKFYFFAIPNECYSKVKTIDINFETFSGKYTEPKLSTDDSKMRKSKWAQFLVNSIEELAKHF